MGNMNSNYYTLPFNTKRLLSSKPHRKCNLNESIAHYIHLVNTSYFGECTFDESFGSSIWLLDFDNLKKTNRLRGLIRDSLEESLSKYEKRLHDVRVDVRIKQEELTGGEKSNSIKKRIDIRVKGKIKKTSEEFSFVEYFYIGPLSY
jgi:Baseplate wedge protein gp25